MPSKYLVFRFNNLPPDITRPQIEQRITPIARNRQCTFSVGPVVNIYNKTGLHVASRSTTITIEGDSCEKVLSNLRHLWITSDSNGTEAFADEKFLGQTVLAENDESTLDVYFVHGLGGHAFMTWACQMRNEDPATVRAWPRDFLPQAFHDENLRARFVTIGFNANVVYKVDVTATLRTFADNLVTQLLADRPEGTAASRRPFYFVCHSLGGLVVCQALILLLSEDERTTSLATKYRHLFLDQDNTCLLKGIVFLGTPFQGSSKANQISPWIKALAAVNPFPSNPRLVEMLKENNDGSSPLDEISMAANLIIKKHKIDFLIGCETQPIKFTGRSAVTVRESAEGVFANQSIPITINGTHTEMVKFQSRENADYRALQQRIIAMVKKPNSAAGAPPGRSSTAHENFGHDNPALGSFDQGHDNGFPFNRSKTEPPYPISNQTVIHIHGSGIGAYGERRTHDNNPNGRNNRYRVSNAGDDMGSTHLFGTDTIYEDPSQQYSGPAFQYQGRQNDLRVRSDPEVSISNYADDNSEYGRLAMFDTVFIVDDTASMQLPADGNDSSDNPTTRWEVLEECLEDIIGIATHFDKDGVDIQFLKTKHLAEDNIMDPRKVLKKLQEIRKILEDNSGGTEFCEELENAIRPRLEKYEAYTRDRRLGKPKPLNLVVITDGHAHDQDEVEEYLGEVAGKLDKLKAPKRHIGVQFVQIGDDEKAAEWLNALDDELSEKKGVRDMIDTTPFYKMDRNEPTYSENFKKLLLHTLLGAVTKALDAEKIPAYKRPSNIHQRPQNVHEVQ